MAAYPTPDGISLVYRCDVCGVTDQADNDAEMNAAGWHVVAAHAFCVACKAPSGCCEPCQDNAVYEAASR
jgi:hypothetical protein